MRVLKRLLCLGLISAVALSSLGCGAGKESSGTGKKRLLIAHSHNAKHPVNLGLEAFKSEMEQETDYSFSIYPNGQLGGNAEMIQMVRGGVLDIAKVSASSLEQFNQSYAIFSLPYVFKSQEHYFKTMENSQAVQEIFRSTYDQGFVAIGWYDSGQRSIYTTGKGPVEKPADLNGLKIRTQDSPTSVEMIRNMGGSATPMSSGEVYSALQQGIINGAENNETVLSDDGHGEVAKSYTYTEHQYTPDIVIMSTKTLERMSKEDQDKIYQAMKDSWQVHEDAWKKIVERNKREASQKGVQFYQIDKTPFINACLPQQEAFRKSSENNARYLDDFLSYAEGGTGK